MSNRELEREAGASLLIRRAQLPGRGLFDLRIAGDRIVALASQLPTLSGERVIDARGNVLLPGLHDHHLHLFATAAARASVVCGPPVINDENALRFELARHYKRGDGWIRGIGFHDSVCEALDRYWLDAVCPDRPVRIQHRSGMLWILNSCALDRLHLESEVMLPAGVERANNGALSGRFFNLDEWLGQRFERAWPSLRDLSTELARFGITGVTDTGVANGRAVWEALTAASERGDLAQRLLVMGSEELNGLVSASPGRVDVGPLKLYLREIDLPDIDALALRMRAAHEQGRAVAVHCVTLVELYVALAALDEAGAMPGDRIEHAAIADDSALQRLAELGVTVVTQPHFIAERGDRYLADVDAVDVPLLYRGAAFLREGVALAAGSDAPYGATDPWAAMRAAVTRRTRDGVSMAASESLTPAQALALFSGDLRRPGNGLRQLAVGQVADLCLLDLPFETLCTELCNEWCADLDAGHVALTLCGGRIIYEARQGGGLRDAAGDHSQA